MALGAVGALLIFAEGVELLVVGAYFSTTPGAAAAIEPVAAGLLSIVFAIFLGWLLFSYDVNPEAPGPWGTGIVIVSAISLWVGGGFLVGSILGLIGGIVAILAPIDWEDSPSAAPAPAYGESGAARLSAVPPFAEAGSPSRQPGPVVRYCPSCGAVNGPANRTCMKCGAEFPVRTA
ncbi:MAG: hypothetical protein WA691_04725 [Thermoplasmata archaeon]